MIRKTLRIIIGLLAFLMGVFHFVRTNEMAVYVPLPFGAVLFVYIIGVITIFASFGIITNKHLIGSFVSLAIAMSFSAFMVQIPILLREREYYLRVIGLSNMFKLGLSIVLLLMSLYYKKNIFINKDR